MDGDLPPLLPPPVATPGPAVQRNTSVSTTGGVEWPAAASEATTPGLASGQSSGYFFNAAAAASAAVAAAAADAAAPATEATTGAATASAPAVQRTASGSVGAAAVADDGGMDLGDRASIRSGGSGAGLLPTMKRLNTAGSQTSLAATQGANVPSAMDDDDDEEDDDNDSRGADAIETGSIVGAAYAAAAQTAIDNTYNDRVEAPPMLFGVRLHPQLAASPYPAKPHKDEIKATPGDWRKMDLRKRLNQWRLVGNLVHFITTAWWVALLYYLVGAILYITIVGRPYAYVAFRFGRYFFWPFGKYVELLSEPYEPEKANKGFQSVQVINEDSGYYAAISVDDPQRVSRVGAGEDSVHEYLTGGRGVRFTRPKRDKKHPGSYVMFFVWLVLYCLILAPVQLVMAGLAWFSVGFIPIARVYYTVGKLLIMKPLHLRVGSLASEMRGELVVCTYRAFAKHYFFDSLDGMNIVFVNLLPFVLFALFDGYIMPIILGDKVGIASPYVLFVISLISVLPLVYYVGMGVACVSAQSSFAIAAVVNATFGSIVEIVLYIMAVIANKGVLVIGSIIGSLFGTLMFLPGLAMIFGGLKIKEQRFNSRAQGVSSTLLLMSVIVCFTPTAFFRVFGPYKLECVTCPTVGNGTDTNSTALTHSDMLIFCEDCSYHQLNPVQEPFYIYYVLPLIYFTVALLPITYAVGLYFSLKTHSDRIYLQQALSATKSQVDTASVADLQLDDDIQMQEMSNSTRHVETGSSDGLPARRASGDVGASTTVEGSGVDAAGDGGPAVVQMQSMDGTDGFGGAEPSPAAIAPAPLEEERMSQRRLSRTASASSHHTDHSGGHKPPPWSRRKALFILITSTVLFALLAEILVTSVDIVLAGTPITEKFIGVTLFAIVPSLTEYVNAILFAMRNNIALSMEISSQYTVQVTLLQLPILVIFSFIYNTFLTEPITFENSVIMIFDSFDVFTCSVSLALMLYVYSSGRTDYFKGTILSLVYVLFIMGYWMIPNEHAV